jgi:hypothetical protein
LNTSDLGRKIQASIVQGMYVSEKVLAFRAKRQQEKQRKALEESYQQSQHRFVKGQKSSKPLMRAGNRTDKVGARGPM